MRGVSTIALFALVALIAAPALAVTITLNDGTPSFIRSSAYDGATADDGDTDNPTSLPSFGAVNATVGGSSSTTGYTLSNAGFEFAFGHARTGTRSAYSESDGSLNFSVDVDSGFVLEGDYSAIDADGRWTAMEVHLYDRTAGDYLFQNLQRSNATPDESFTLGREEGDLSPELQGSLTGNLLAGHQYQLYFIVDIWNSGDEDATPASASGTLRLTLVPEFTACGDGIDNDGDGFTDYVGGDPGCADSEDLSENDPTLPCDDGADNDSDGRIDFDPLTYASPGDRYTAPAGSGDPGCQSPSYLTESPQCQDGIDNDADGNTDYDAGYSANGSADPTDPDLQCVGMPWKNREANPSSCGIGVELASLLPPLIWIWRRRSRC
jgi:hypothetical protein